MADCSNTGKPRTGGQPSFPGESFPSFCLSTIRKLTASYVQEKVQGQSSCLEGLHFLSPGICLLLHISVQTPPGVGWEEWGGIPDPPAKMLVLAALGACTQHMEQQVMHGAREPDSESRAGHGVATQWTVVEIRRKVQTRAGTMAQGMQMPAHYVCNDSPPCAQDGYIMQRASRLVA